MATRVDAVTVKRWLSEPGEIAFLDVREAGQFGEAHPFFAIPVAYSQFESRLPLLAPNTAVRVVLIDAGNGVSERAARRAEGMGYSHVNILEGGIEAWSAAGYTLFAGVNLPSKTFGEIVELRRHTPRVTAHELQRMRADGVRLVIVDSRPFSEYQKMNIPGGICCPNGELALRISEIADAEDIQIVVNCAGRTRSIIGAETLRAIGVKNKVVALENGTQGWFLAGLELERGAGRRHGAGLPEGQVLRQRIERARDLALKCGVGFVDLIDAGRWLGDRSRTTYLLDVRTPEEHAARPIAGAVSAPGGQLIQATDQWVGVKGARLILIDDDGVRAPMVAHWLVQLGHESWVLQGGADAAHQLPALQGTALPPTVVEITAVEARAVIGAGAPVIDVRSSADFRSGHIAGAVWSIRPRLADLIKGMEPEQRTRVVLVGPRVESGLAVSDLVEAGVREPLVLGGGAVDWKSAGLDVVASPELPPDSARIDYLFFVHDRHDGNAEAARRYLAWETGLLAQLDDQERGVFRVADLSS